MPHTVTMTSTVYTFAELSDCAKETARDWYRSMIAEDAYWAESIIESAAEAGAMLGVDMRQRPVKLMDGSTRWDADVYWSVDRGGDVDYAATYRYERGASAKVRKEWPQDGDLHSIANRLQAIQRRHFYGLTAEVRHSRGNGFGPVSVEVFNRDGYEANEAATDEVTECLRDFAQWIHSSLMREWDYVMSDEYADEGIEANGYEFDEDGNV